MEITEYRERTIQMINGYLNGDTSAKEASDWAFKIIISKEFEQLPPDITEAVLTLFDLHDINLTGAPWLPSRDAFIQCKTDLEKNR
jgi:hypothetical protein